ncbi:MULTISPECIES: Uma2 family endonuclease [unclassified Streptomyces]|uniref:Uma2 family endonuclease n=1 Tax=unclassified Streptomyces TaxID=2593676 RepID=UPI0037FC14C1
MTVLEEDRINMADHGDDLDSWFERLERMPVPEGYRVEIVEGAVHMTPQRNVHWQIIRRILHALEARFGMDVVVLSDVRIDFPGHLNGFSPDLAKVRDGVGEDAHGRWRYQDIEFVAEVISKGTATNDYGSKKLTYATAGVPVYMIADPYTGKCHVYTDPKKGDYRTELSVAFGAEIDLTGTVVDLTLPTDGFPRD